MLVQGSWEIDAAKECEAETICEMSQSMDETKTAIDASCLAIPNWGAATCTPISTDPSYSDKCSVVGKDNCEAVVTWVTSDDVAATATGLIKIDAVADGVATFSPPACVYTPAATPAACVAPDATAAPKVQRTTCMDVPGCAYTAAMLAKAGAVGSETPGACIAVSGEGVCTYKPTTALVAAAICVPDVLESVLDSVVGTCKLDEAQTGTEYTDDSCVYVSGVESGVTCKLTDAAGAASATGATGDGVLEECYEETHAALDDDDEDGSCTFERGTAEYIPSLCMDSTGSQVMGTCGAILDLATTAMTTPTCLVAGTGTGECGGTAGTAANSADCLASATLTTPVTSCLFAAATKTV